MGCRLHGRDVRDRIPLHELPCGDGRGPKATQCSITPVQLHTLVLPPRVPPGSPIPPCLVPEPSLSLLFKLIGLLPSLPQTEGVAPPSVLELPLPGPPSHLQVTPSKSQPCPQTPSASRAGLYPIHLHGSYWDILQREIKDLETSWQMPGASVATGQGVMTAEASRRAE